MFAAVLWLVAMTGLLSGRWKSTAPTFFSFLPVVFILLCQKMQTLSSRPEELGGSQPGWRTTPG